MGKSNSKSPGKLGNSSYTTNDGLNVNCVSLAGHRMVPSNFEDIFDARDIRFLPSNKKEWDHWFASGKFAKHSVNITKQSFKEYAATKAQTMISKGREEQGKGEPREIIAALGSDEEIYSTGADCGMFSAVFTAYSHHYKLRTSPDDWWFCVIKRVAGAIDQTLRRSPFARCLSSTKERKLSWFRYVTLLSIPSITNGSLVN